MENNRDAYRVLVGRHKGKRPFARPRLRWEENIEIDHQDVGKEGMD